MQVTLYLWCAKKQKTQPNGWDFFVLVAGAGLEPTTFGL